MATEILSAEYVRTILDYEPLTGLFTWRQKTAKCINIGAVAGGIEKNGYRRIRINGRRYLAHRLAWLYMHGDWPSDQIDHINRVQDDNRSANLRLANQALNNQNRGMSSNNSSGIKGVYWYSRRQVWKATIGFGGKKKHLGYFTTIDAAEHAYKAAVAIHHRETHSISAGLR